MKYLRGGATQMFGNLLNKFNDTYFPKQYQLVHNNMESPKMFAYAKMDVFVNKTSNPHVTYVPNILGLFLQRRFDIARKSSNYTYILSLVRLLKSKTVSRIFDINMKNLVLSLAMTFTTFVSIYIRWCPVRQVNIGTMS